MGVASRTPDNGELTHPPHKSLSHAPLCRNHVYPGVPTGLYWGSFLRADSRAETPEGETESQVSPEPPRPTAGSLAREVGAVRTGHRA